MKNIKLVWVVAGILAMAVPQMTQAQDKPEGRPSREELRERFQNLSPEEREAKAKEFREKHPQAAAAAEKRRAAYLKEIGLDVEELKKLPESERRVKIKEASDKKLAELQKKNTDGTITDAEKQMLERMERAKKFFEERAGKLGGERKGTPGKPSRPADK